MDDFELEIEGLDNIIQENTAVEDIDSEVVNLIFVGIDQSGSMCGYSNDMKKCLSEFKDALLNSKEADEMLIARGNFSSDTIDIGGYKAVNEFDAFYAASGLTPLYPTIIEAGERLLNYIEYLKSEGMRVKAVFSIFSDGEDTTNVPEDEAKEIIKRLNEKEIVTAFISFGPDAQAIAGRLGFKNKLNLGASASELRKAFNCLSKSVVENSKSAINKHDDFFDID